jgi:uncharacterized protein YndB with AHSA1/START domain
MPAPPSRIEEVLEYEKRVAARPETIFGYFTDPAKMVQWMGTEATLDPRPGGVCRINPTGHAMMAGEFVEVDPPHRVVFTWGWETELYATPAQSTLVEVSLTPEGDETVVRILHRRLKAEAVGFHRLGWEHYLPRLERAATGADPGPDAWHELSAALQALRDAGL